MSQAVFDKPRASAAGDTGSEGTASAYARSDHVHDRSTDNTSSSGISDKFRKDTFSLASATPTLTLTYIPSNSPTGHSLHVYAGSAVLVENTDYTQSGQTITILSAAGLASGDQVVARYAYSTAGADASTGYASEVIADNPLAYWRLDDAGSAAVDFTGNGHDATSFTGSATRGVSSLLPTDTNKATQFTTNTAYFTVPDSSAWDVGTFSLEVWTNHGASGGIALFQHDDRIRFENSSGKGRVFVGTGTSTLIGETDASYTTGSGGKQIGFTYTSTTLKFYKNGVQYGSTITHSTALPNVNNPIYFGQRDGNDNATMDELSIYSTELSAARWAAHYAAA